jgi:hypothetical protein
VSINFGGVIHSFSECSHITGCFFYCLTEHGSFSTKIAPNSDKRDALC